MWKVFNVAMRIVSTLLGLLLIAVGTGFTLQGLNLAFNGPMAMAGGQRSFMVGDPHWVLYGVIIALLGIGQVVWSNIRQSRG